MIRIILILSLITTACQTVDRHGKNSLPVHLDSLIMSWHDRGKFDGVILVGTGDSVVYEKAIGTADRSWNQPMALQTKFDIASLSKSFVAVAVLQLAEAGQLNLHTPIGNLLDYLPERMANQITPHHLLTHTSGIGNYEDLPQDLQLNNWQKFKRWQMSREAMGRYIADMPMNFAPDAQFRYSNFGYYLLVNIIETLEKKPVEQILQEKIFHPLQMKNTVAAYDNRQVIENLAEAYNWSDSANAYCENQYIDNSIRITIYSTAIDLYKWARALTDSSLLSSSSLQKMTSNHLEELGMNYGYGLAIHPPESRLPMGNLEISPAYVLHGGSMEGYKSMMTIIDQGKWTIITLSNIGDKTSEIELTKQIIKIIDL